MRNIGRSWFIPQQAAHVTAAICRVAFTSPSFVRDIIPEKYGYSLTKHFASGLVIIWYQLRTYEEALIDSGLRHCGKRIRHIPILTFTLNRQLA